MNLFLHIFTTSIIPILALISIGVILDKQFTLDLRTLSKLNFYIFLPAYIVKTFYTAHLSTESFYIIICALIIVFTNSALGGLVSKWQRYDIAKTEIVRNAIMFNNGGNLGVALASFVFSNVPYVVNGKTPYLEEGIVAVIATFIVQTILCNTLGFYQAGVGKLSKRDALRFVMHMPILYAVPLSILARFIPIDFTSTIIWGPLEIFGRCFVGAAMITLGVQLNRTSWNILKKDILLTTCMRLIAGPILAITVTMLFIKWIGPIGAIAAQGIVITYSVPSAVNTALMAVEMKNNPELATQIVLSTTLFSALTMPIAVLVAYYIFPV